MNVTHKTQTKQNPSCH